MRRQSRLSRAVDAILRDRRPKRFPASTDEAAQLRIAAMLRAAHPGADLPSAEFVDRLAQQLRRQVKHRIFDVGLINIGCVPCQYTRQQEGETSHLFRHNRLVHRIVRTVQMPA